MLENKREALEGIGQGDYRSSGTLSQSGNVVFATTDLSMDINDLVVRVTTGDSVDVAVTLPPVAEAKGRIYSISLVSDGGKDVVLDDYGDDASLSTITMDTVLDYAILYSDGYAWRNFASESA